MRAIQVHGKIRGFHLSDDVANFLLKRVRRDVCSLIEVIEVLDNEPSLVDMKIRKKGNQGDRFNNKKKQRKRPHKSKRMGSFKRTFGEDRR